MGGKQRDKSWILPLVGLYVLAVGVRFVLALATAQVPTLNIDEFLYTGLARSIGTGEGLLFRGQTANYNYLMYPLFLSPVYALFPSGTDYFRILELWSILLMQSSVFPIYALASELFGGKGKKPLLVSALSLLLPDFLFGEILLSECLIYPLFFAAAYFGYRFIEKSKMTYALATGVLAGLLYETKPGQMALPLVLLLAVGVRAIKRGDGKTFFRALSGILAALAMVALMGLVNGNAFSFTIYNEQVFMPLEYLDRFFRALALYPSMFVLICGAGCFLWPLMNRKYMSESTKLLFTAALVSLGATIVGTAWSINTYEYSSDIIYLRYIAMYVPLMAIFTLVPLAPEGKKKPKEWLIPAITLGWMAVSGVLFGLCCGYSEGEETIGALSGVLFINKAASPAMTAVITALSIAGTAAVSWVLIKKKRAAVRCSVCLLTALMLVSGAEDYGFLSQDNGNNESLSKAGSDVLEIVGDDEYLYAGADLMNIGYSKLAVNSRQNASYVMMSDLFNAICETGGVYRPFIPAKEIRGTILDHATVDTEWIVMDNCVYDLLQLNASAEHCYSNETDAGLHVVRIRPGERWVDSVLGYVKNYVLNAGDPGILLVFEPKLMETPIRIRVKVDSPKETTAMFLSEAESKTVALQSGAQWVEADFENPQDAYNIICSECDLKIYGYEIIPKS